MKTVNEEINRNRATYNSTIMIGITALVLIARDGGPFAVSADVTESKQTVCFDSDFRRKDQFVFSVWIIEILILAIIAGILGLVFAFLVANFSSRSYGVKTIIHLGWWQTLSCPSLSSFALDCRSLGAVLSHIKKQGSSHCRAILDIRE